MARSREIINDLTVGSVPKKLLTFALPFMLSTLLQTAYGMVDMMVVGRVIGSSGLSAVSLSTRVMWMTTALCMGFTNAGQILIAQLIGAGKREDLQKTIGTLILTVFCAAMFITLFGLSLTGVILRLLRTPPESMQGARQYLLIAFTGTVFTFGYNLVSAMFRGMGDSKHPLMFVAIAASVNLVLDILAVGVLGMGVAGAALATVAGQAVSLVISVTYLYRRRDKFGFDFKRSSFRFHKECLKKLVRLGVPFAMQNAAISISMLFVTSFVNSYGVVASATFGTGTRIEEFPWIIMNGIMAATATMVGQNMGAGKQDRMRQVVTTGVIVVSITAAVVVVLFLVFPRQIYSLFTSDEAVLELCPKFMLALACSVPATSLMCPYQAFIEGIGNARLTLIIALLDGFVSRIAISLILAYGFHMGLMGWFFGYGMAAYVNTIISMVYYYGGFWKKRTALV